MSSPLEQALEYLRGGWRPIALQPRKKGATYVPWGEFRDRVPTEEEIRAQFSKHPDAHLGLVVSDGVFRVDLDGGEAEQLLMAEGVVLPDEAPRLRTGRSDGGYHVYLRTDGSLQIPAFTGDAALAKEETEDGKQAIEIRVNDVAPVPPTIHPNGRAYEWIVPLPEKPADVPLAPIELLRLISNRIQEQQVAARRAAPSPTAGNWIVEGLRGVSDAAAQAETANRLCSYFFDRQIPKEIVREILMSYADRCDPPMALRDVDNAIRRKEWGIEELEQPKAVWHSEELIRHVERRLKPRGDQWAAPTPLPSLNRALRGGWKETRLYYVGGEPGFGKTAFVVECLKLAAREGLRSLMVSAEMPRESIYDREIASEARVDVGEVEDGVADAEILRYAAKQLARLPIAIAADTVQTIQDIEAAIVEVEPHLVVVDYLQLLSQNEKGRDGRERVESVSKSLKKLAKKHRCAIVCVSSLSRPKDRKKDDEMPTNSQLRESGAIEFDADGIVLFGRIKGDSKARMTKNRFGPTGTWGMRFEKKFMSFAEVAEDEDGGGDDYEERRYKESAELFEPGEDVPDVDSF